MTTDPTADLGSDPAAAEPAATQGSDPAAAEPAAAAGFEPQMTPESMGELLAGFYGAPDFTKMITAQGDGWLTMRLPFDNRQVRPGGTLSGPTQMLLADTAAYFLLLSMLGPIPLAVTSNLNIDFLRKPRQVDMIARAEVLKLGRRLAVCRVTIASEDDSRPVSHATVTYALPA